MKNSLSNIGPTGHMIFNTQLHNYQQQYYRGGGGGGGKYNSENNC